MAILWNSLPRYQLKGWYQKWKKEKWFESEIFRNLRKEWYICYHPQDVGLSYKFLDWIIVSPEWDIWFIEFKKIEWATYNISHFEESQIILLKELDRRNQDIARVFIYSVKNNDYRVYKFTELWTLKNENGGIKIF